MKFLSLLALLIVVGTIAERSSASSDEHENVTLEGGENHESRRLRGPFGQEKGPLSSGIPRWNSRNPFGDDDIDLQLDRSTKTEGDVTRVIISCRADELKFVCKKRILDSAPEGCLRFVYYLREANAFSVKVKSSCLAALDDLQEDPVRETLHIPDSLEVHHGRDLQSAQAVPYGINLVRAQEVWSQFGVKGENVRVCGK
jgi:hypothetical protein